MAISRRLLNHDESVVVATRTHGKALIGPLLVLIVLASVAGYLSTYTSGAGRAQPLLVAVIWALTGMLAVRWVFRPFLVWLTTTYTLTDHRLISRSGVFSRRGHDIPISRISDVAYERGLMDRVLGCGTLVVSVASDHQVELEDIPQVEQVHMKMHDLIFNEAETRYMDLGGSADR
ncbi:MAG TPA: PH domain-containing protein [Nocardioidaceae bacterium]|nr:PH domain-containing protein [Nocardioidaceae bacterium]